MTRKRGRPRKFQGDKDHVDFDGALERTAPVVMTFMLGRALAAHLAGIEATARAAL